MSGHVDGRLDRDLAAHGQLAERGAPGRGRPAAAARCRARASAARRRSRGPGAARRRWSRRRGAGSSASCLRARPRSMVSRTSRCCGPSWMSRSSRRSEAASAARAASRPPSTRRTSCWSSARLLEQHVREAAVQGRREPHHQRQGDQRDGTDDQVEHDLGVPALAEAEQLGERGVARPGRRGSSAARTSRSGRRPPPPTTPPRARRRRVPVTSPTRHQTHVEPGLRVAQRQQRLAPEAVLGPGAEVRRRRGRLAEHAAQPDPLEPGEAAGHHDGHPEQQHARRPGRRARRRARGRRRRG